MIIQLLDIIWFGSNAIVTIILIYVSTLQLKTAKLNKKNIEENVEERRKIDLAYKQLAIDQEKSRTYYQGLIDQANRDIASGYDTLNSEYKKRLGRQWYN